MRNSVITLQNRYSLERKIGSGGSAEVWLAYDEVEKRRVAVKILRYDYARNQRARIRFQQEAQTMAKLSELSHNIVRVYGDGYENGQYFYIMEYIDGPTLKEYIAMQKNGCLAPAEALHIAEQIAAALEVAHEHNIVHCDIKSHNILISEDKRVCVTDFGIACSAGSLAERVDEEGNIMASVYYLSPEQAMGEEVTHKSDLYSLGIVLFEMLTGRLPFEANEPYAVAMKHIKEGIPSLRLFKPNLPDCLEEIMASALAKNPHARFADAAEFRAALEWGAGELKRESLVPVVRDPDRDATQLVHITNPYTDVSTYEGETEPDGKPKDKPWYKNLALLFIITVVLCSVGALYYVLKAPATSKDVAVPQLEGLTEDEAQKLLDKYNLKVKIERIMDAKIAKGKVVRQEPLAANRVKEGRLVTLFVSKGTDKGLMRDLKGMTVQDALSYLKQEKMRLGDVTSRLPLSAEDKKNNGKIIAQSMKAGEKIRPNIAVDVTVILEDGAVIVPDVRNVPLDKAQSILQDAGLKCPKENMRYILDKSVKVGNIIDIAPNAWGVVHRGQKISLTVCDAEKRKDKIDFSVPGSNTKRHRVVVKARYELTKNEKILYDKDKVQGGARIARQFEVYGPTIVEFIVDGVKVKEQRFE